MLPRMLLHAISRAGACATPLRTWIARTVSASGGSARSDTYTATQQQVVMHP